MRDLDTRKVILREILVGELVKFLFQSLWFQLIARVSMEDKKRMGKETCAICGARSPSISRPLRIIMTKSQHIGYLAVEKRELVV